MNKFEVFYYSRDRKCHVYWNSKHTDTPPVKILDAIPWAYMPEILGAFSEYGQCEILLTTFDMSTDNEEN